MSNPLHILMVEDSESDALLLARELTRGKYQVTAERVETAEELHRALTQQTWDVVFCDFTMPRFSGKAALQIVQETDRNLPFIYVSGTIGEDVAMEAVKAGAHDYVMKNNLARLVPAVVREIREAMQRRYHERAEAERVQLLAQLKATVAEVRRLGGVLPICSECKSIRDDHGVWQEVEHYLQKNSVARFDHSLCPKCLDRIHWDAGVEDRLRD